MTSKMAEEHYKESHKKVQNKQKYFTSINEFKLMCDLNFQTIKEERKRGRERESRREEIWGKKWGRKEEGKDHSYKVTHTKIILQSGIDGVPQRNISEWIPHLNVTQGLNLGSR